MHSNKMIARCLFCMLVVITQMSFSQQVLTRGMPLFDEIVADWRDQDDVGGKGYKTVITSIIAALPASSQSAFQTKLSSISGDGEPMENLYVEVCSARRVQRMANLFR
jgi:hypothetical protein